MALRNPLVVGVYLECHCSKNGTFYRIVHNGTTQTQSMLLAAEEQNTKDTSAGVGKSPFAENVHSAAKTALDSCGYTKKKGELRSGLEFKCPCSRLPHPIHFPEKIPDWRFLALPKQVERECLSSR